MAENAPPVDEHEAPAPKAGRVAAPVLELIASIPAVLDGGQAKAPWAVAGKPGDDGDFEYIAIARLPDLDVSSKSDGQKTLAVTIRPDANVIAAQVNAIGGGQVAGTKVELVDPDTNLAEGEPAETDDQGRVVLLAPENKPYRIRIVEDTDGVAAAPSEAESAQDDTTANDAGHTVFVKVFGPGGVVKANLDVEISPPSGRGGAVLRARTNAAGEVHVEGVAPGMYVLAAEGKQVKVPTLGARDLVSIPDPYRALLK